MPFLRFLVVCAALALGASGCAARTAETDAVHPRGIIRNERLDPWRQVGQSPTVEPVEFALHAVVAYGDPDDCPFRLLSCGTAAPRSALRVDALTCRAVSEYADRCSFRLREFIAGADGRRARTVRSRCTGTFVPNASSFHSPWVWSVSGPPDPPLACGWKRWLVAVYSGLQRQ